jgi:GNAT superfamily N-acetyltransferase
MRPEIVPFGPEHLDGAAQLLATRVERDCARIPGFDARFTDPSEARGYLQARRDGGGASGVVALQNGRLVGYLLAHTNPSAGMLLPHRTAYTRTFDHAASGDIPAGLYQLMYATLSPAWLAAGHFCHAVFTPVGDVAARDAWVSLGFGEDLMFGRRAIIPVPDLARPSGLEIRRGGIEDLPDVTRLYDDLFRHHARVPSYLPYLPEYEAERRSEVEAGLADPAIAYWLGCRDGRALGVQVFRRLGTSMPPLVGVVPESAVWLGAAQTEAHARGSGIGSALLARGLAWAQAEGYSVCAVSWSTGNLVADAFWRRHDFQPYLARLVRVVDPRIAWARG